MFRGLNPLMALAALAGAVLMLPPAAFADCRGNPSAVNVYTECLSSGGGGKHASSGGTHTSNAGNSSSTGGQSATSGSTGATSVHISKQTAKALKRAGADGQSLFNLVRGYGGARLLQSSSSGPATEPTAVGSAFDLGSGPTALLVALAGTAVLLLAVSGYRGVRQRRR